MEGGKKNLILEKIRNLEKSNFGGSQKKTQKTPQKQNNRIENPNPSSCWQDLWNPGHKNPFCAAYQTFCCELRQVTHCAVWIIQDGDAAENSKEEIRNQLT